MAIAGEGEESQVGWDYMGSRFLGDVDFEALGQNAARCAVRLLGSRNMRGCRASVILDNSVTVDFLGILASSLSSEAVQKGKSLLTGKIGKRVISSGINIIDSGLLGGRLGSSPVDGEGVPSQEKILVSEGVLKTFLYNTYTANKGGTVSTGNAVRGPGSLPSVGISNLFMSSSPELVPLQRERLFNLVSRGLYVVDAMGVHTANPISGEFSVGVTGIWIEDGQEKYPVKEAVISGNILDFFDKITAVGDDLRFYGNMGAPSLVISDVDISA
jgi:PmbA protein